MVANATETDGQGFKFQTALSVSFTSTWQRRLTGRETAMADVFRLASISELSRNRAPSYMLLMCLLVADRAVACRRDGRAAVPDAGNPSRLDFKHAQNKCPNNQHRRTHRHTNESPGGTTKAGYFFVGRVTFVAVNSQFHVEQTL